MNEASPGSPSEEPVRTPATDTAKPPGPGNPRKAWYLSWLIWILVTSSAVVGAYLLGMNRAASPQPVQMGAPLYVMLVHGDDEQPNKSATRTGTMKFTFCNLSADKSLTIHFPPLAVYEESAKYNFRRLVDRAEWPKFATEETTITLEPGGAQDFEVAYDSLGPLNPTYCFMFGNTEADAESESNAASDSNVYVGCVVTVEKTATEE
jgi:hypothetical protein